jgi:hypothetical protein
MLAGFLVWVVRRLAGRFGVAIRGCWLRGVVFLLLLLLLALLFPAQGNGDDDCGVAVNVFWCGGLGLWNFGIGCRDQRRGHRARHVRTCLRARHLVRLLVNFAKCRNERKCDRVISSTSQAWVCSDTFTPVVENGDNVKCAATATEKSHSGFVRALLAVLCRSRPSI